MKCNFLCVLEDDKQDLLDIESSWIKGTYIYM